MRVLFWGTPDYAVPSLDALVAAGHQLVGVVSQPDRRRGRGKALMPSPVKARALALGLPVFTPERIRRDPDVQQQLAALGADVSVVVAFGQILPPEVLNQPPLGCWNGHGSLLPRWRGAAPIQWSLMEGDTQTGVGIMAMEQGLDTGPVLLERTIPIGLLDNAQMLGQRLSQLTAELLVEALPTIAAVGPGPYQQRLAQLQVRPQGDDAGNGPGQRRRARPGGRPQRWPAAGADRPAGRTVSQQRPGPAATAAGQPRRPAGQLKRTTDDVPCCVDSHTWTLPSNAARERKASEI